MHARREGLLRRNLATNMLCICAATCGVTVNRGADADEWRPLFNGRNLDGLYTIIDGQGKNEDPDRLVQVHDGMIHIYKDCEAGSRQPYGYFSTEKEYSHYHLRLQYKWGTKQFAPRANTLRDSGVLFHLVEPDMVWPTSIECQVQEGDTGDLINVRTRSTGTIDPATESERFPTYKPAKEGGKTYVAGWILASEILDRREGWNTVELIVRGSQSATHIVNGRVNNHYVDLLRPDLENPGEWLPLERGRIIFQAEAAEVFYRNIEIKVLPAEDRARPILAAPSAPEQDGFVSLFDGKTLSGWKQLGGKAKYRVDNGEIVGTSVLKTPNSFLCTEKNYGDFILEMEFKVDRSLNSGIQIRSNAFPEYQNGRVHGYQCEIDPSARAWSTGIYDEGRRGWLNDLNSNEPARKAFKQNEWNKVKIEAIGDSIKTWLNGVPAADLVDSLTLSGFVGLQVHSSDKEGLEVRWRNIRIKDLGRHAWEPIFDGKTQAGWETIGGGTWKVADGILKGTAPQSEKRHGLLVTDKQYKDFTVRIEYLAPKGNSGLYFRCDKVESGVMVHGFQAEIDNKHDAGGLYETGGRAWVVQPKPEDVEKWYNKDQWNEMTVSAHGKRIVVHVNGEKSAELKNDPGRLEGYIGAQLHGGMDMHVEFRKIELLTKSQ